jgi:hypothetical protein
MTATISSEPSSITRKVVDTGVEKAEESGSEANLFGRHLFDCLSDSPEMPKSIFCHPALGFVSVEDFFAQRDANVFPSDRELVARMIGRADAGWCSYADVFDLFEIVDLIGMFRDKIYFLVPESNTNLSYNFKEVHKQAVVRVLSLLSGKTIIQRLIRKHEEQLVFTKRSQQAVFTLKNYIKNS